MPINAARRLTLRRTGKWLFFVIALGIVCPSSAQKSRQPTKPAAIRDFSQFFNLQGEATNADTDIDTASDEGSAEDEGFVEPLDFSALFSGQGAGSTHGSFRQPKGPRVFGAQSAQFPAPGRQAAYPFGDVPLFGKSNVDEGFQRQNFIKSKPAGAKQQKSFVFFDQGQKAPLVAPSRIERKPARKANQESDDGVDEDDGFEEPEIEDEPLFVNEEESAESERVVAPTKRRVKENRYPKYSSYYHASPAGQSQAVKQADDDADENPFASAEEEDLGVKEDGSGEDEEPEAQINQQVRTYPAKYTAAYTAPKNARPVVSTTNQKLAYNDDPFFADPPDFPVIQIPGKAKSGALQKQPAATGYVDRAIRPVSAKYSTFEKLGRTPFKPSPPDPLYNRKAASAPSYDFDHSPSAEYREAHRKPKRVEYARSASLTSPIQDGRRSAPNKKGNCKKVEKQISDDPDGRFRRDAMTCYVCDDPTSGGTYEQCAYGSEPKTQAYYVGRSQQFRSAEKEKPFTFRQRRYLKYSPYPSLPKAAPAPVKEEGALNRKTRQEHDDILSDGGLSYDTEGTLDDHDDYRFGPEFFTQDRDTETETGESAQLKAAESSKADTPENCQKVTKGDMVCMVCKESKTGGNYEQCSYGGDPKKSSYSYGKSKTYGTPKKAFTERHRRYIAKGNGGSKQPSEKFGGQKEKKETPPKRKRSDESDDDGVEDDLPKDVAENSEPITGEVEISENVPRKEVTDFDFDEFEKKADIGLKGSTPERKGPSDSEGKQTHDDYFSFLFPEYSKARDNVKKATNTEDPFDHDDDDHFPAESKDLTTDFLVPSFFSSAQPDKKELEKMLGEFTQKDRSECKKVMKDQMTCFQCVDAKGMQQEECMFVAASEPKTSHLAYHESKEFKMIDPTKKEVDSTKSPGNDSLTSSSAGAVKTSPGSTTTTKPAIRSRGTKKHESVSTSSTAAPSTTTAPEKKGRKRDTLSRRTRGVVAVEKRGKEKQEQSHDPELEVEEEDPETDDVESGSAAVAATAAEELSNGEIPPEFKVPVGPEGQYSEDTKPIFDKSTQLTLPKYMLSISEHESVLDEVLASGS